MAHTGRGVGTAYITASWNGYTARGRIDLVDPDDTIHVGLVSAPTAPGEETKIELSTSTVAKLGEGFTVSWTVDQPSVARIEVRPDGLGITAYSQSYGVAVITCTVALSDGTSRHTYINILVL